MGCKPSRSSRNQYFAFKLSNFPNLDCSVNYYFDDYSTHEGDNGYYLKIPANRLRPENLIIKNQRVIGLSLDLPRHGYPDPPRVLDVNVSLDELEQMKSDYHYQKPKLSGTNIKLETLSYVFSDLPSPGYTECFFDQFLSLKFVYLNYQVDIQTVFRIPEKDCMVEMSCQHFRIRFNYHHSHRYEYSHGKSIKHITSRISDLHFESYFSEQSFIVRGNKKIHRDSNKFYMRKFNSKTVAFRSYVIIPEPGIRFCITKLE